MQHQNKVVHKHAGSNLGMYTEHLVRAQWAGYARYFDIKHGFYQSHGFDSAAAFLKSSVHRTAVKYLRNCIGP